MSGSILHWVGHLWNRLFAGKKLLSYERLVLDAWRASLPEEGQRVLDEQLQAVSFVQHQAGAAKVCFYYREGYGIPLFKLGRPDLHAATVLLRAEGPEKMRAKIYLHRGRFFSIEFPKRPKRYMQQHHMQERALQVASVENHVDIASEEEWFHNNFQYFVKSLNVLSLPAIDQCEARGWFGVAWKVQHNVLDFGTLLENWYANYLSKAEWDAISEIFPLLRDLPEAALQSDHLQAMNHPAWEPLRTAAAHLVLTLNDAIARNREFFEIERKNFKLNHPDA